jgi:hypothetical protein
MARELVCRDWRAAVAFVPGTDDVSLSDHDEMSFPARARGFERLLKHWKCMVCSYASIETHFLAI